MPKRLVRFMLTGASLLALALTPASALGQSPAPAGCAGAVEPVAQGLAQAARDLTGMVGAVATIEGQLETYYQTVAVPAGQTLPNHDQVRAATAAAKRTAEGEIAQLPGLQLRCAPNPAASVARLNQEVGEAMAATRDYRAAVRGEVLALRTAALRTSTPGPDADRGADGP